MRSKLVFILAIVFGLATAGLLYNYINDMEKAIDATEYVEVVVANRTIEANTIMSANMVTTKKIPSQYVHQQELRETKEVIGKTLRVPMAYGQSIYREHLLAPGESKDGLAYLIPVGKRALTVAVDEVSGIAGLIKPGDRVDVITTIVIEDDPYTVITIQDIKVLAVGREMERKNDQTNLEARTITLAVDFDEAKPLMMASQRGAIRLMLRSPHDNGKATTLPFELEDFLK